MEAGQYIGYARSDERSNVVVIRYAKDRRAIHEIVWQELGRLVVDEDRLDEEGMRLLQTILGVRSSRQWTPPNVVRNDWNYRCVERYGKEGEMHGAELGKLLLNAGAATLWSQSKGSRYRSVANEANGITVLREVLRDTIALIRPLF